MSSKKKPAAEEWQALKKHYDHVFKVLVDDGKTEYIRHNLSDLGTAIFDFGQKLPRYYFLLEAALVKAKDCYPEIFFPEEKKEGENG